MNTIKIRLAMSSVGALAFTSCCEPEFSQPNVVIIFTDDQGYGDLGCYGATNISTPNIDALADSGVRFTDFHVAASSSSPSRAALFTGCYPLRVGVPRVLFPVAKRGVEPNTGLNPQEDNIASLLSENGYSTSIVGKWHLGHVPELLPTKQGFDSYFGIPYSNDMAEGQLPLMLNDLIVELNPEMSLLTKRYTEAGVDFIESHAGDSPFFLYLAHSMPHVPIGASPQFEGRSKGGLYGDVIEEIDWSVGEIISALKRKGVLDNTLVIFLSDNGPNLSFGDHAGSSGVLRAGKSSTFEGGVRVPCIVSMPNFIEPRQVSSQLFNSMDILPTICEMTGARTPSNFIDGKSVLPIFRGEEMQDLEERPFYYYTDRKLLAVRVGDWKYINAHKSWSNLDVGGVGGHNGRYKTLSHSESLYNLREDIKESVNLVDEYPEKVAVFKDMISTFDNQMRVNSRDPGVFEQY